MPVAALGLTMFGDLGSDAPKRNRGMATRIWGVAIWATTWLVTPALVQGAEATAEAEAQAKDRKEQEEYYELYKVLADTLDQVERNYVEDVDRRELFEAAIEGILEKLDPYSNYISPEELSRFKTSVEQEFGGIGIQVGPDRDGGLRVTSPLYGTPAYRAGLMAGDRIVEVEGESTEGLSLDEAVRRMKGEAGTKVTLTVLHPDGKRATYTIEREVIHVQSVLGISRKDDDTWNYMLDQDKKIGYVRLTAFSRDTVKELRSAIKDLQDHGMKGLVLDLRFNPGGLLNAAIEVSDMFVSEGRIVSTRGKNTPERTWEAEKSGTFETFPMVVLVNHFSASASEIVAACLQDHSRAIVIGERTWGKGSVQNVVDLEEGKSALKLTTASYWRPSGKNIHRGPKSEESDEWGVKPNEGYEVKFSNDETFALMEHWRERDILRPKTPEAAPAAEAATEPEAKPATEVNPAEQGQPSTEKPAEEKPVDEAAAAEKKSFDDRQLSKAVDYLSSELAKAN
jgi:carboxyl-terminal processing protease